MVISATSAIQRKNPFAGEDAWKLYANTQSYNKVSLNQEDTNIAVRGLTFLKYPTELPIGCNVTTMGAADGCLNMHPTRAQMAYYEENGVHDVHTFMTFG